jgi:hypothetical protein
MSPSSARASACTRIPIALDQVAAQPPADACCSPGFPAIRCHSHALRRTSQEQQVDDHEANSYNRS